MRTAAPTVNRKSSVSPAAFSLVEILRVLYDDVLRYDAKNPGKPTDRTVAESWQNFLLGTSQKHTEFSDVHPIIDKVANQ